MINSNSIKLKLEERQKQNVCRAYLRRAVYFVLWWIKTLYFAAVAPFIILAFFFWIAWFSDSVTMATVHNVLTQVVTGATPDEWAKGSPAAFFLLTLPIAVVIFWRLIASTLCNRICKTAGDLLTSAVLRLLLRIKPVWATEDKATTVLIAIPVIILLSGIIVMSGQDRAAKNRDFPTASKNGKPITGVAISMPGGKTISGPALVTRDGDHWIVNFNGSVKPKS